MDSMRWCEVQKIATEVKQLDFGGKLEMKGNPDASKGEMGRVERKKAN